MYQSTTHSATLADVYLRVQDIGEVKGIASCEKGERQIEVALQGGKGRRNGLLRDAARGFTNW